MTFNPSDRTGFYPNASASRKAMSSAVVYSSHETVRQIQAKKPTVSHLDLHVMAIHGTHIDFQRIGGATRLCLPRYVPGSTTESMSIYILA